MCLKSSKRLVKASTSALPGEKCRDFVRSLPDLCERVEVSVWSYQGRAFD
jgi:hypothetical protein